MRRKVKTLLALFFINVFLLELLAPMKQVSAAQKLPTITQNSDGTVTIKYKNTSNKRVKVLVIKGNKQYQYEVKKGKSEVKVPLTQGNGTYKIMVVKQIQGTKYAPLKQQNVTLKLTPSRAAFKPTHIIINFNKRNSAIKKAKSLVKGCKTKKQKITVIWNYIVKNYSYDYVKLKKLSSYTTQYVPDIESTFKTKKGICYDISALFSSMLRSVGIEAKLQTGYCKTVKGYHAWNKVYDSDKKKWYIIDCTYDLCKYKGKNKVSMIKSSKQYNTIVYEY